MHIAARVPSPHHPGKTSRAHHIPAGKDTFHKWMTHSPWAHAITLVIAARHHAELLQKAQQSRKAEVTLEQQIINEAWSYQISERGRDQASGAVDVDRECVAALEVGMFMRSASAGKAGYHQWGLDAGDHQDQWWPWNNLESGWHNPDAAASDEDLLKVCPFQQI